ncbi:MAG: elongation factor P hydroxylase [Aliiglaciecola sp.]|uniref:elongation factor P hydroxylase n=1 Tax=Aliiglaciecola sp. M165 TaxID=2593649 RepID=UPI00117FB161|nr:elongation factor P hydroxylase [Aliiglaciecola sp. M165]TRY29411.1 elongation factor P hydroxylase [Aliiglaciecola sp. M165]
MHHYQDLIQLFNQTFSQSDNTRLVKGEDEPVYLPASDARDYHQIVFAHGYFASALHEIAHWCIAGRARRQLEDYGYWYCPDGRNAIQQADFEKVEVKPQAIECAFSLAARFPFQVSTDNLNGVEADREGFAKQVEEQLTILRQQGFPPRAARFLDVLDAFYSSQSAEKSTGRYSLEGAF